MLGSRSSHIQQNETHGSSNGYPKTVQSEENAKHGTLDLVKALR